MFERRYRRCRLGSHLDDRIARGAETALYEGDHLTILHGTAEHLAHRLALAQHLGFEAHRGIDLQRTDEGDRQRAHRTPLRHFRQHGLVHQRGGQATETGTALAPARGNLHVLGRFTHALQ